MNQKRKPESKEAVNARSRKHRANKTTGKVEIVGLKPDEIQEFQNLPGLENLTHAEKLRELILYWKQSFLQTPLPLHDNEIKLTAKVKPDKALKPIVIHDLIDFEKKFLDFLDNLRISNRLNTALRRNGAYRKKELGVNTEYLDAFNYICGRLTTKLKEPFKKMFLQGYFNLNKKDVIGISKENDRDTLLLLLFETLKLNQLENPLNEARKRINKG